MVETVKRTKEMTYAGLSIMYAGRTYLHGSRAGNLRVVVVVAGISTWLGDVRCEGTRPRRLGHRVPG